MVKSISLITQSIIAFILLSLSAIAIAHGAPISNADKVATVEHMRKLVRDAQTDLIFAKREATYLQGLINAIEKDRDEARAKLEKVEKERDFWKRVAERVIFALSLTAGILAGFVFFQFSAFILRVYPPAVPFSLLISIGIGVTTFGATWAALVRL
jgi:hypothetical protein